MLAHVNGLVAEKGENMLVIDCGGVGYQLTVSAATLAQAPAAGEMMKCFTYLSVREDAVELFGFATREEKKMFLQLTSVSGIGPKSAIQALSAKYLVENEGRLTEMLLDVPREVDLEVANRKLDSLGIRLDTLTSEQRAYLNSSSV